MSELSSLFENFLLNFPALSFIYKFKRFAALLEPSFINVANLIFVLGLLGCIYRGLPSIYRTVFIRLTATFFILLPAIGQLLIDYMYDTSISLINKIVDLSIWFYLVYQIGNTWKASSVKITNVMVGIGTLTLIGIAATLLGVNKVVPIPFTFFHFIFSGWVIISAWKKIPNVLNHISPPTIFAFLLVLFPFIFYLVAPSVPDADITTVAEMMGYLFQGQSFSHVLSGVGDEWYSLRYPGGLAALGWINSHLLNIRASEALLLLWFVSFITFVINLMTLARKLKVNPYLVLLFSLNTTITSWGGLRGGQVQEILTYALGISVINFLLEKRFNFSAVCLGAAIVIHPVVSLPFCLVWFTWGSWHLWKKNIALRKIWPGTILVAVTIGYIGLLSIGKNLTPSQPQILLSELTFELFFKNIWKYLWADTLELPYFLLSIGIILLLRVKHANRYLLIIIWLIGALIVDGLFGHTKWGDVRFLGNFSVVGPWIVSIVITYYLIDRFLILLPIRKLRMHIFHNISRKDKPFLPLKVWPQGQAGVRIILFLLFVALWVYQWEKEVKRAGIPSHGALILSSPLFSTHDQIRMGRYVEENLPSDILIANVTVPPKWGAALMMPNFRGDSSRNTIFARIGDHQIKNGKLRTVDYEKCLYSDPPTNKNINNANGIWGCFSALGATHLVLNDQTNTSAFFNLLNDTPIYQIGNTALYSLSPHSAETFMLRASGYINETKYEPALKDLIQALEINPQLAEAYNFRGTVYAKLGQESLACANFQAACKLGKCNIYNDLRQKNLCP